MTESTALATTPNPMQLLQLALDKGLDVDKLGRLMELAAQWRKDQAAEAFSEAITDFQAQCPTIFKSRKASGKFEFAYAALDDIMAEAGPILAKTRLAVTFTTKPTANGIEVTCRVRHGTHFEETVVALPIPAGVVNNTQLFGQAVTYGKRYAMCAALNITVTDDDNDAAKCLDTLLAEEVAQVEQLLAAKAVDRDRFLAWAEVATVEEILRSNLAKTLDLLRRKADKPSEAK